jgi:hypothetical protein
MRASPDETLKPASSAEAPFQDHERLDLIRPSASGAPIAASRTRGAAPVSPSFEGTHPHAATSMSSERPAVNVIGIAHVFVATLVHRPSRASWLNSNTSAPPTARG